MRSNDDQDNSKDNRDRNVRFGINGRYEALTGNGLALYVIDATTSPCKLDPGMVIFIILDIVC